MDANTVQKYAALVITVELQIIKPGKCCGQSDLQQWDGGCNPVQTNRNSEQKSETPRDKMDPSKDHTVLLQGRTCTILLKAIADVKWEMPSLQSA